jgi:long-chain acyl-CoA synthetase
MNIFDCVARAQERFSDKEALIFKGQACCYRDLYEQACRLSGALRKRFNLQRGDRAALFLPNIPEFITAYYALQKLGVIVVSLNVMLKRDEVQFILRDSAVRVLITAPSLLDQVPKDVPAVANIVTVGETNRPGCLQFSDLLGAPPAEAWHVSIDDEDGAALLYTSGTTGQPKGVLLTHGNLVFNSQTTAHHTRMTDQDRLLCFLPLFHCFGQNFIMNTAMYTGATLVLHERFVADEILESALSDRATMFFGVPAVYVRLLARPQIEMYLDSVRYYFSAAAPLSVETVRRWRERLGQTIYEGYGLTETAPFATYNHDSEYREGSVGTSVDGVQIKIVNENGESLPPGELGEIAIKGPNVMKGYFNRPEETARAIRDGWFLTGDIGRMDESGYLFLVDRVKDMVNVSGYKVWPREVEEVLSKHSGLNESAVIGVPDPVSGEAVKAFVVVKEGETLTEEDLIKFCRSRMAVYKAPRYVEFIDALPRNPTGKVLKRELRLRESERKRVA